jgi:hypothetical protein
MFTKKALLSIVVVFLLTMALGFVVHGVILAGDYQDLPAGLMRSEEDAMGHFPFMILAHVVMACGLTWVYMKGRDGNPWLGQGVRFGLLIALVSSIPFYLIYHAVSPYPIAVVVKQVVFDTIGLVLIGVVLAAIHRE